MKFTFKIQKYQTQAVDALDLGKSLTSGERVRTFLENKVC